MPGSARPDSLLVVCLMSLRKEALKNQLRNAAPPIPEDEELETLSLPKEEVLPSPEEVRVLPADTSGTLSAAEYFQESLQVDVSQGRSKGCFQVYLTPPHGSLDDIERAADGLKKVEDGSAPGMITKAPWAESDDMDDSDEETLAEPSRPHGSSSPPSRTLAVCLHGAGYCALSFAVMAKEVQKISNGTLGVLAIDMREHGKTEVPRHDGHMDMARDTLVSDVVHVLKEMFPVYDDAPDILLVGHSMGGAIAAFACDEISRSVARVSGLVLIDIVEGSAIDGLARAPAIIAKEPKAFRSMDAAVRYLVGSGAVASEESARVSAPGRFKQHGSRIIWRFDASQSEPFWHSWFAGLTSAFNAVAVPKLLLVGGVNRLDKDILVAQMQGKFQLVVWHDVGHAIQEDVPQRTARAVFSFWARHARADQALRKALQLKTILNERAQARNH